MIASTTTKGSETNEEDTLFLNKQEEIDELIESVELGIQSIQSAKNYIETLAQLNSDIRAALREIETKIEELDLLCNQSSEYAKRSVIVDQCRKDVSELKFKQRKANQHYQSKSATFFRKYQREKLLAQTPFEVFQSRNEKKKGTKNSNSTYKRTAGKVTQSLEVTKQLLSQQLNRTANSMQNLSVFKEKLEGTMNAQRGYEEEVKRSGALIKVLEWQEKYDQYLTLAAFLFFCFVCLYIFNKRIPVITLLFSIIRWFASVLFSSGPSTSGGSASPGNEL